MSQKIVFVIKALFNESWTRSGVNKPHTSPFEQLNDKECLQNFSATLTKYVLFGCPLRLKMSCCCWTEKFIERQKQCGSFAPCRPGLVTLEHCYNIAARTLPNMNISTIRRTVTTSLHSFPTNLPDTRMIFSIVGDESMLWM